MTEFEIMASCPSLLPQAVRRLSGSGFNLPANKMQYLVLVPASDGDRGSKHWHMRYGSKSLRL